MNTPSIRMHVDKFTAQAAARLCCINLDLILEADSMKVRETALITATHHCELVELYAKQPGADPLAAAAATELRNDLELAQQYLQPKAS